MTRRYRLLLAILLSVLPAAAAQSEPSAETAAKPGFGFVQLLSTKGIVTAKGERSLAIREGGRVLHVIITHQTRIGGLRTAFAQIVVSDIVRVEGTSPTPSRVMTANQIEVLFAAETTERLRAKRGNTLWDWIQNGGVTVDLP